MRASSLPSELGQSFSVTAASDQGVTPARLRARDLEIPFRGVRRRADAAGTAASSPVQYTWQHGRDAVIADAIAYAQCMTEHEFFCLVTAAVIWDIPLPLSVLDPTRLHVGVFAPHRASKRSNVTSHQARPHTTTTERHAGTGLIVASPASTWASLATVLENPYDLVAAADAIVRVDRTRGHVRPVTDTPLATPAQLRACVESGRRVGIRKLREALPRVRTGSASRTETWTRLILVDGGLPEPVLDHDVYDEFGMFVACVDMAYPDLRIAIEYDGEQHRTDSVQWSKDIDRLEALAALGWHVIRVERRMLFSTPSELLRRVRAARARRGA